MGSGNLDVGQWDAGAAGTPAPTATDLSMDAVKRARSKTLLGASLQHGVGSTFLTGSRGISNAAPTKTILGA